MYWGAQMVVDLGRVGPLVGCLGVVMAVNGEERMGMLVGESLVSLAGMLVLGYLGSFLFEKEEVGRKVTNMVLTFTSSLAAIALFYM